MGARFLLRSLAAASLAIASFNAAAQTASPGLLVVPEVGFGSPVEAQVLTNGMSVYLPSLRYTTDSDGFTVDVEYTHRTTQLAPGFGPMPVLDFGRLPPGTYAVRVNMVDVDATATPMKSLMQQTVVQPPAPGLYTSPRQADTSGQTRLVVSAGTGINATSVRVSVGKGLIRVDYELDAFGLSTSTASVALPPVAAGSWRVEAWATSPYGGDPVRAFTTNIDVQAVVPVVEYYADDADKYFVTSVGGDVAALDRGDYGDWKRTGQRFKAWALPAVGSDQKSVCRFYSNGSNSHYFTLDGEECDRLKAAQKSGEAQAALNKAAYLGMQYEGVAFYALPAFQGSCPSGTTAISRFSRTDASGNKRYRFTDGGPQYTAMAATWTLEGVAFCAPL